VWQEPSVEDFWDLVVVAKNVSTVLSDFLHLRVPSALQVLSSVLVHPYAAARSCTVVPVKHLVAVAQVLKGVQVISVVEVRVPVT